MTVTKMILLFYCAITICFVSCTNTKPDEVKPSAAQGVLLREIGQENSKHFTLRLLKDDLEFEHFSIKKQNEKIIVEANSEIALCRGTYDYLKNHCNSIVSWSGSKINFPRQLPEVNKRVETPYKFRYYFNVVTHGYTTAYWDWQRWEKEIDWMALHGINMPLIGGAHEAILYRVFTQIGLSKEEINQYFTGPAHFPWNRMGNINGWDGPPPDSYYPKQIELTHKMLERMRALGMSPIVHAFAGFVPKSIRRIYPEVEIRELSWGIGFPEENNAYILSPSSEQFVELGALYIKEWEKEFGEGEYYLADSFNEMDVPLPEDSTKALAELAGYGELVYISIKEANPNATWVMQGWTFPFHRDHEGNLFWTPERLEALVSKVPDDKLLILDLANEYNHAFWKIDPSWKMYKGFFGKKWIYSFIPNMGGKVPLNGILELYATLPIEALKYEHKKNLVGFGFAPEGIENNEIIYELLSDMGWRSEKINLSEWQRKYSLQRYGAYPERLEEAFELLNQSCFGTFTDHPRHRYQFKPYNKPGRRRYKTTVHNSENFRKAVSAFLSRAPQLAESKLFQFDAIELVAQYLGLVADDKIERFLNRTKTVDYHELNEAMEILLAIDQLLASHPNHSLKKWVDFARAWGDNDEEKNYYESNAKRLLTTWGTTAVNDYSARTWSGLIRDYYVPRWKHYYATQQKEIKFNLSDWEEQWIKEKGVSDVEPFLDPLTAAIDLYNEYE